MEAFALLRPGLAVAGALVMLRQVAVEALSVVMPAVVAGTFL